MKPVGFDQDSDDESSESSDFFEVEAKKSRVKSSFSYGDLKEFNKTVNETEPLMSSQKPSMPNQRMDLESGSKEFSCTSIDKVDKQMFGSHIIDDKNKLDENSSKSMIC